MIYKALNLKGIKISELAQTAYKSLQEIQTVLAHCRIFGHDHYFVEKTVYSGFKFVQKIKQCIKILGLPELFKIWS